MTPTVAIILCTRDRAESLRETLASIGRCAIPADLTAELLVVDNGSTDGTADVVRETRLSNGLPIRHVQEPHPGQVHARNAGLRASRADAILFTDDDVRLPLNWIDGMCRPILSGAADAVAGWVHFTPTYETLFTRAPLDRLRGWFASTDDIDPRAPGRLVGANMAFSRRVVKTVGEFDPELGPGALGFFDDSLWSWRITEAGFRTVAAAPEISVEHHFDHSRLTRRTLLNLAERMGRSSAWVDYHWSESAARVPASTRWRTNVLLPFYRLLTPWRVLQEMAPFWELQRVQNRAYLNELNGFVGQPRKYRRAPAGPV